MSKQKSALSSGSRFRTTAGLAGLAALILFTAMLSACGTMGSYAGAPAKESFAAEADIEALRSSPEGAPAPRPSAGPEALGKAAAVPLPAVPSGDAGRSSAEPETGTAPGTRLRVYSAELTLSAASVEQARGGIIAAAEGAGGYIESSGPDLLVVRVPAGQFERLLGEIASFGEVRSRTVQTADVTEQYADLERRIAVSERSRSRLYELLDRAKEPAERLAILREIRRLTEEVERLRSELSSLSRLVSYSRISIRLLARILDSVPMHDRIPFEWIASLDPVSRSLDPGSEPVAVEVPADYAVFTRGRNLAAEAADGTRLRIGGTDNEPRGDAAFWERALVHHLGPLYRSVRTIGIGPFRGVLFESRDASPYLYLVALTIREEEIVVAEAFFPNPESARRRLPGVRTMLEEAYR